MTNLQLGDTLQIFEGISVGFGGLGGLGFVWIFQNKVYLKRKLVRADTQPGRRPRHILLTTTSFSEGF